MRTDWTATLSYTANAGQTSIDAYTWGFDNGDRVTTMTSTADGSANYGYDSVNELTSATYTGANQPANEAYSFDKNGNRNMAGYSTGSDNLLTSDGTFNYQHDADGNRTIRTRISNAQASDYQTKDFYDYRNRLTDEEYFNNSGTLTKHVHYVYDTLDHQIGEQIDDTGGGTYDRTERFALDGGQPIALFDANGNMIDRNLVAPISTGVDAVMAQEGITTPGQAGSTNWTLPDNLGTPHDEVNSSGAVADHIVTDSFGQVSSQSNAAAQPWTGFGGGHADTDTGDVTNGARRYDASTGDWTTKDPLDFAGGDANTGRYAANSPTNAIDPTGLFTTSIAWGVQNGKLRETMTGTSDNGVTTSSYVEILLDTTATMQCTASATFSTPTTWQTMTSWAAYQANTSWLVMSHPIDAGLGALHGAADGAMMFVNAFTWHQISSLDSYVNQTVAQHGGVYSTANAFAHVSAYATQTAALFYGLAYWGITEIGVVPISSIPTQIAIEYWTWGMGAGGGAAGGASNQPSTLTNPPTQGQTLWPPPGTPPISPPPKGWDGPPPPWPFGPPNWPGLGPPLDPGLN
jgi:RHS repeat-associated protein